MAAILLLAAAWSPWTRAAGADLSGTFELRSAVRLLPGEAEPGITVMLPDTEASVRLRERGTVRYRVKLPADQLDERQQPVDRVWALYLDHACGQLEILLNGQSIYVNPHRGPAATRDCLQPHLAPLPLRLLRPGDDEVELRITGVPLAQVSQAEQAIGLSTIRVGEHLTLQQEYQAAMLRTVDAPAMATGALLLLGLVTLCLSVHAGSQKHLRLFSALSLISALYIGRGWWYLPGVPDWFQEALYLMLIGAVAWGWQRFICRYADITAPWLNRLGNLLVLGGPAALMVAGMPHLRAATLIWSGLACAHLLAAALLIVRRMHEPRQRPIRAMTVAMLWVWTMALSDLAVGLGWLDPTLGLLTRSGLPLCLIVAGILQVLDFSRQSERLESLQRSLEERMTAARKEIEANFLQLAEDRIAQVTLTERKRIAGDLHDDLGAKLLTIVHTSHSDRIAVLAREALDEMRLSVRGLTGRPTPLSAALADWRTEAMSRTATTGVTFDWPMPDAEIDGILGARTMVQTTRILREAFNNVIRHSRATHCTARTTVSGGAFTLLIEDNGQGFDADAVNARNDGLGLLNMRFRAEQLKGTLDIESMPGQGTRLRLTIPIDSANAAVA